MGSPIRTSPDQSVLTAPRSFSQLATSFFAFLCLGIPTHALSSLTIKFPVAPAPFLTPLRLPPSPQASATRFRARFHPKEPTLWKSSFPIHIGLVLKLSERAFPLLAPIPRPGFPFPATEPSKRETHLQFFLPIILFSCQRSLSLHPEFLPDALCRERNALPPSGAESLLLPAQRPSRRASNRFGARPPGRLAGGEEFWWA